MRFENRRPIIGPDWTLRESEGENKLFYGDNFEIMSSRLGRESVDLIYLDPPFNSNKNYNIVYSKAHESPVPEQVQAFSDTWTLDAGREEMARTMPSLMKAYGIDSAYVELWRVWTLALKNTQPELLAYLVYMIQRLILMKSVLRPSGSIYFHCDPTASHYLKVMMDGIFGYKNFRNEIIWKRTSSHNRARKWGDIHDVILFYSKSDNYTWNDVKQGYSEEYIAGKYKYEDERGRFRFVDATAPGRRQGASGSVWNGYDPDQGGRHWAVPKNLIDVLSSEGKFVPSGVHEQLDALAGAGLLRFSKGRSDGRGRPEFKKYLSDGQNVQDVVTDIMPLNSQSAERIGYPTQKPIELISRIIEASSKPGDVIFDPFCGCGTTLIAAERLNRRWIGCDIAILPINIAQRRLDLEQSSGSDGSYVTIGVPQSVQEAISFSQNSPAQFVHWIIEFVGGFPVSPSSNRDFDGLMFDRVKGGGGTFPIIVTTALRRPEVARVRSLVEAGLIDNGLGIITVTAPSGPAIAELQELRDELALSRAPVSIQVLALDEIVSGNQRFRMPSALGYRYVPTDEPRLI